MANIRVEMEKENLTFKVDVDEILNYFNLNEILNNDWNGELMDFGYIDDMVFNIACEAEVMYTSMRSAITIIHNGCLKLCLTVNYSNGKTEALVKTRGKTRKH